MIVFGILIVSSFADDVVGGWVERQSTRIEWSERGCTFGNLNIPHRESHDETIERAPPWLLGMVYGSSSSPPVVRRRTRIGFLVQREKGLDEPLWETTTTLRMTKNYGQDATFRLFTYQVSVHCDFVKGPLMADWQKFLQSKGRKERQLLVEVLLEARIRQVRVRWTVYPRYVFRDAGLECIRTAQCVAWPYWRGFLNFVVSDDNWYDWEDDKFVGILDEYSGL